MSNMNPYSIVGDVAYWQCVVLPHAHGFVHNIIQSVLSIASAPSTL